MNKGLRKNTVSFVLLAMFLWFALACYNTKTVTTIDKETGICSVSYTSENDENITETKAGKPNDTGQWNGEVTSTQPTMTTEPAIIIQSYTGSKLDGPTRYYDKNKKLLYTEYYKLDELVSTDKPKQRDAQVAAAAGQGTSAVATTKTVRTLEGMRPWYITKLEKFGFSRDDLNTLTAEVEKWVAAAHPRNEAEYPDVFFDALEFAFDQSGDTYARNLYVFFREVVGIENSKTFEIRLAELGRYRGEGTSTYEILAKDYPAFIQKMAGMGANSTALKAFTDELDTRMNAKGPLDITDPLFLSIFDQRMEDALREMDTSTHPAVFSALGQIFEVYFNEREPLLQAAMKAYFTGLPTGMYPLLLFGD